MTADPLLRHIANTAKRIDEATADRDLALVAAVDAGLSLRVIAGAAGLSHQTVANIVARHGRDVSA